MIKLITTKNAVILIIVLLFFSLVPLTQWLLTRYSSNNDNQLIWSALATGLAIFFLGQIRKYHASRKGKTSIISSHIPELDRLFGVVDDNLIYIVNELNTIPLPGYLTNEIKVTCQGFQKVLSNAKDRTHMLENEFCGHSNSWSLGSPEKGRDLATTIDSINNAIVDQLDLMHNLVVKFQKLKDKDDDDNIALTSVLLNESGGNIWQVYANIKDEFKRISGSKKEVKEAKELRKTTQRVIKVSDTEYQLPCSVCGEIAAIFRIGIPKSSERKSLIYKGIIHETGDVGNTERIFEWLEEDNISGVHFHVIEHETMKEGIDAYCPDCDKIYCRSHYNPIEERGDDGWYYCTYGTCPEGHKRMILD